MCRIDISQIRHVGCRHVLGDPLQIKPTEFIPFRQDHHQIGIARRLVRVILPTDAGKKRLAFMPTLRVNNLDLGAAANQRRNDRQARRIAHIVGVGLEGDTEDGDRLAIEAPATEVEKLVDHPTLDLVVNLDDCLSDLHRYGVFLPDTRQRLGIFGET